MSYHIYAIGQKHDSHLSHMIEAYEKRLARWGGVSWTLLPYASHLDETARRAESAALLQKIKTEDYIVLLDERGKQLAQHVGMGGGESLSQHRGQVDIVGSGHRVIPLLE